MPPRKIINTKSLGGIGAPKMEVRLFGDWDKVIRMVQGLGRKIKISSIKAQIKVCREIEKRVKRHLRNQDLGWQALNPIYADKKQEAGLDHRTLFAYGTYYNAITVWQKPGQHFVFVGVKKGIYTKRIGGGKSKIDVATIAAIHELSSGKKIPRRPLWNPTIQEIGGIKGLRKMYLGSLIYWLRMSGVPVKPFMRLF